MPDRHAAADATPVASSWRTGLAWLTGLLILGAVVAAALHFTELQRFAELAQQAEPIWLLAAAGLQVATYFAAAGYSLISVVLSVTALFAGLLVVRRLLA